MKTLIRRIANQYTSILSALGREIGMLCHGSPMRRFALAIMLIIAVGSARAADKPFDLAATLRPLAEEYHLPGVVGAIIHGDDLVALGSVGIRKIGNPAPFQETDIIHLGSDTKAMTAILIGQLIDKKQLTIHATMAELFPELVGQMNAEMAKITVRNLLTHTAGLPHDLDWWAINGTHLPMMAQRRQAVEKALSAEPATPIGKFSYSNISFVILGAIVESKTGQQWEKVMEREIFHPLHMTTAGFGIPGIRGKVDQPWGHVMENGKLNANQIDNAPVMAPAGEVHCSITDWAKFVAEAMHGAQGHPTLVSPETFKELTRPIAGQDYAGGWIVTQRPWAGGLAMTHAGSNTTWYCNVWIAPKKNFAVLIATNDGAEGVAEAADKGVGLLIDVNGKLAAAP
jgi:CubicO group peptidase (beta-lactamase class C family)